MGRPKGSLCLVSGRSTITQCSTLIACGICYLVRVCLPRSILESSYQKHAKEMNDSEMKEYRYVPKKGKKEALVKVKYGDNSIGDLTMER